MNAPGSITGPDQARTPTARRRRALFWLLLASPVMFLVGGCFYSKYLADARLAEAIAVLDREDPHWRLPDLEKDRLIPEDSENSAIVVQRIASQVPGNWPSQGSPLEDPGGKRLQLVDAAMQLPPQVRLSEEMAAALRTELDAFAATLDEARSLKDMPRGGTRIVWDPVPFNTLIPHTQDTRRVARLLQADVLALAQAGEIDAALASVRATLNVARSIGDEPTLISSLVRMAVDGVALASLERVLAQGEASPEALRVVQQALVEEEADPTFYHGLRGERAAFFATVENLRTGTIPPGALGVGGGPSVGLLSLSPVWMYRNSQTLGLEYLNRSVQAARATPEEMLTVLEEVDGMLKTTSRWKAPFAFLLLPATQSAAVAHVRTRAMFRCSIVMVAAERYRIDHRAWPESLEQLVPDYLDAVPNDPFGKGPLRMLRRDDGLTIYSVATDGIDDGAKDMAMKNWRQRGNDLGVRLWGPEHRRQDPPVKPKDPQGEPMNGEEGAGEGGAETSSVP